MGLKIHQLYSGGIITNYICSSKCKHCLYACGPERKNDYIGEESLRRNCRKIKSLGCSSIHIGGGEPMLKHEGLLRALACMIEEKVNVEYIETNSSWFKDHDSACRKLKQIKSLGVDTLLLSISPFHNEYIPFSKVKGVISACRDSGMGVFPWISSFVPDIEHFNDMEKHSLDEYIEAFGEEYFKQLPQKYSLTMKGRPIKTFGGTMKKYPLEEILSSNCHGCAELSNVSHFHIDLYGNYLPGLCAGLSIFVDDLGTELSNKDYPFLNTLHSGGIGALLQKAVSEFNFKPESEYISKCDLCFEIRKFIVLEKKIDSKDLKPKDYYSCT